MFLNFIFRVLLENFEKLYSPDGKYDVACLIVWTQDYGHGQYDVIWTARFDHDFQNLILLWAVRLI